MFSSLVSDNLIWLNMMISIKAVISKCQCNGFVHIHSFTSFFNAKTCYHLLACYLSCLREHLLPNIRRQLKVRFITSLFNSSFLMNLNNAYDEIVLILVFLPFQFPIYIRYGQDFRELKPRHKNFQNISSLVIWKLLIFFSKNIFSLLINNLIYV